jgi:hypothetical protein
MQAELGRLGPTPNLCISTEVEPCPQLERPHKEALHVDKRKGPLARRLGLQPKRKSYRDISALKRSEAGAQVGAFSRPRPN